MHRFFIFLLLLGCESPLLDHEKEETAAPSSSILFFRSEGLYATAEWQNTLTFEGNSLEVNFFTDDSLTLQRDPTNIFYVCAWMGIHGHGSDPVTLTRLSSGRFIASNIGFIMPGPWEMRLYLLDYKPKDNNCDPILQDFDPASIAELKEIPLEIF